MKFNTIKDLKNAILEGKVDEGRLEIVLDNDCTNFYLHNGTDEPDEITIKSANGYYDIEELYSLVFSKAKVDWC